MSSPDISIAVTGSRPTVGGIEASWVRFLSANGHAARRFASYTDHSVDSSPITREDAKRDHANVIASSGALLVASFLPAAKRRIQPIINPLAIARIEEANRQGKPVLTECPPEDFVLNQNYGRGHQAAMARVLHDAELVVIGQGQASEIINQTLSELVGR